MSSVSTIVPTGALQSWCMTSFDPDETNPFWDACGRETKNATADFQTICCDGEIIDTELNIWAGLQRESNEPLYLQMEDMVCCRQAGRNPGGLLPLNTDYTQCASGEPTPLASMAATNTENAQNFAVTYISASAGTADWTTRSSPSCIWINTKSVDGTTAVVLPAADITTLPKESDDYAQLATGSFSMVSDLTSSGVGTMSGSDTSSTAATTRSTGTNVTSVGSVSSSEATPAPATSTPAAENAARTGYLGMKWMAMLLLILPAVL